MIAEPAAPQWVTDDQQAALRELVDGWPTWLFRQLDLYWPDWTEATDAARTAWVDQMLSVAHASVTVPS